MKKIMMCLAGVFMIMCGITFAQDQNSNTGVSTYDSDSGKVKKERHMNDRDRTIKKEKHMNDRAGAKENMKDKFIKEATSGGNMEVELGKYAKDNASSEDVKNFGDMMVTDHSKANDQLMDILKKNNMIKDEDSKKMMSEHQKNYNMLTKMKGTDFDKHYMKMMVEDHKKDIKEFEKASKNEKNADVKNWATNTLPTLKKHLQRAEEIEKNLKNQKMEKTDKTK